MEIIWKWNYHYLNFTPDFHFLLRKWNSQRAKTTLPYINPFYPIPSPPIEWTIWPVNEFYYSNYILIVYCWQFFSCPKIHVYYISIIDDHEKFVFKWKKNHQTLNKNQSLWFEIPKLNCFSMVVKWWVKKGTIIIFLSIFTQGAKAKVLSVRPVFKKIFSHFFCFYIYLVLVKY